MVLREDDGLKGYMISVSEKNDKLSRDEFISFVKAVLKKKSLEENRPLYFEYRVSEGYEKENFSNRFDAFAPEGFSEYRNPVIFEFIDSRVRKMEQVTKRIKGLADDCRKSYGATVIFILNFKSPFKDSNLVVWDLAVINNWVEEYPTEYSHACSLSIGRRETARDKEKAQLFEKLYSEDLYLKNNELHLVLAIAGAQSAETDKTLLPLALHRRVLATLHLVALLLQPLQKNFKVLRLLCKDGVDDSAQTVTVAFFGRVDDALLSFPIRLVLDGGELVLQADQIAQPLHRKGGEPEVAELLSTVQGGGIINNVVVDVRPVGVGSNDKSVLALQKTLGKLVADAVGFLRRDLPRLERLPHLISDHIAFLAAPGGLLVQPFCQQKFFIYRQRAALIAAYQLALLGLVRVLNIAGVIVQTRPDGLSFIFPHGDQPCCCQCHHPLTKRKCRTSAAYFSGQRRPVARFPVWYAVLRCQIAAQKIRHPMQKSPPLCCRSASSECGQLC